MGKKVKKQVKKHNPINVSLLVLAILAVCYVSYGLFLNNRKLPAVDTTAVQSSTATKTDAPKKTGALKTFTGQEFRDLYNNFAYPNTEYISEDTVITGTKEIDKHIQDLAIKRGYVRRSAPVADTFNTVQPDIKLQQRAAQPWLDLKAAATKEGLDLNLTAAYRSSVDQRTIFLSVLSAYNINKTRIPEGIYDAQITQALSVTAIPGYSRHHTGYTIDIGCGNQREASFEFTVCFKWLKADNYRNAKTYGWIPSYPEGAGLQGPEPEAWEYVWVGTDAVTE